MFKISKMLTALVFASGILLAGADAHADKSGKITSSMINSLAAAQQLKGPKINQGTFKDKPVFIVFFASW